MENAVAEIERLVPPATNLHPQYSVRSGDVAEQLLRVAKLETADLVVMGVQEKGSRQIIFPRRRYLRSSRQRAVQF
jgi:nucleotide-binding universal stress UspA family protein